MAKTFHEAAGIEESGNLGVNDYEGDLRPWVESDNPYAILEDVCISMPSPQRQTSRILVPTAEERQWLNGYGTMVTHAGLSRIWVAGS